MRIILISEKKPVIFIKHWNLRISSVDQNNSPCYKQYDGRSYGSCQFSIYVFQSHFCESLILNFTAVGVGEIDQANQMNAQSLEEQQMRRDQDQEMYAGRDPQPRPDARVEAAEPATMLVFRDQRKQEVQNYAIVGQTLWSFSGQRTQKIPISDLD